MVSPRAGTRAREATSPSRRGVWTGSSGYGADPRPGSARAPGTRPARGTTGDGDASGRRRRTAPRSPPSNSHRAVSTGRDSSPPRGILPSRCGPRRRRCAASGGRRGRAKEPEEPGPRPGAVHEKKSDAKSDGARPTSPSRAPDTRGNVRWGCGVRGRSRGAAREGVVGGRVDADDDASASGRRERARNRARPRRGETRHGRERRYHHVRQGAHAGGGVVTEGGKGRAEERARIIVYLRKILPQNSRERDAISAPAPNESPLSSLPIGSRAGRRAPHARNPRDEGRRRSRLVGRRGCIALVSTVIPPPLARALERRIERC